ncbi:hypothetical protein FH969_13890 [Miniimonas arenae]|uniref:Mannose-6-phosphate isomerase n=1 Tax=Miniimonas arenae TaxID=676201 RepID=A0A5C5B9X6_9MICO|nr:hypothetical protein FH969_13890 [Miniimonas arenae]
MRVAPEHLDAHVAIFFAPVEDFELAVIEPQGEAIPLRGAGPRIALGIAGEVEVHAGTRRERLTPGRSVFLEHGEDVQVSGTGRIVRASVP